MRTQLEVDPVRGVALTVDLVLSGGVAEVPSNTLAAEYAKLMESFRPVRSRISFYSPDEYLHPSNWAYTPTPALAPDQPSRATERQASEHLDDALEYPHLTFQPVFFRPGDILVRSRDLPVRSEIVTLPLSISDDIGAQKQAFEEGLPPMHAREGGMVMLERKGDGAQLDRAVRAAMGYS